MKYPIKQQLASLVTHIPAPNPEKRGSKVNAYVYLMELAFRPRLESNMIAANQWSFPLAAYREHYTKLGVMECNQNAQGEWRHALILEGVKKVVKQVIEGGDSRTLGMLNEPVHECYELSLDKIFPEYLPGTDAWMRVMSMLTEEDRRITLRDLRRCWDSHGYYTAQYEAQQSAQVTP